jgi:type VI secretion system protein VasI
MRFFAFLFCGSLFFANPALAQSESNGCVDLKSDLERLSCFDELFADIVETTPPEIAETQWTIRTETSPIDDKKNVFLSIESEKPIRGRFGSPGPMMLTIMCRENTTDLSIYFNGLHMSDHQYGTVTYRLDKEKAERKKMVESTSNKHLGLWGGAKSIPFLKQMFGHERLLVEAIPFRESSVLGIFEIGGIEEQIKTLRKACSW